MHGTGGKARRQEEAWIAQWGSKRWQEKPAALGWVEAGERKEIGREGQGKSEVQVQSGGRDD